MQTVHSLQTQQASQRKQGNWWRLCSFAKTETESYFSERLNRSLAGQDFQTSQPDRSFMVRPSFRPFSSLSSIYYVTCPLEKLSYIFWQPEWM